MTVSLFARDYPRKQPFASASSAGSAMAAFGWDTLEQVVSQQSGG
jgi:hypothetical protein